MNLPKFRTKSEFLEHCAVPASLNVWSSYTILQRTLWRQRSIDYSFVNYGVDDLEKRNSLCLTLRSKSLYKTRGELSLLERVCCKKWQKSPNQRTELENWGYLKVLNDTKLVQNEPECPSFKSFGINLISFRASRGPLFTKPVSWLGLFLPFLTTNQLEGNPKSNVFLTGFDS